LKAKVDQLAATISKLERENAALKRKHPHKAQGLTVLSLQQELAAQKRSNAQIVTELRRAKDIVAMLKIIAHAEKPEAMDGLEDLLSK